MGAGTGIGLPNASNWSGILELEEFHLPNIKGGA
jgi:hypothetical protein